MEEDRLAVISIIVEDRDRAFEVNNLLHEYGQYIIARMGVPYKGRSVSIICVILDAPADITSSLSGKLGMIKGVISKTMLSKQKG